MCVADRCPKHATPLLLQCVRACVKALAHQILAASLVIFLVQCMDFVVLPFFNRVKKILIQ